MGRSATAERPSTGRTRHADDLYTWVQEQVALLRAGHVTEIDAAEIAEELGDVGSEQYDKLESALEVLLMHLLKWDHQPNRRSRSWQITVAEQRRRAERQLARNPGLKSRLAEAVEDAFALGRLRAARDMDVAPSTLPEACPYDWATIMQRPIALPDL